MRKIKIFTSNTCPHCTSAKEYLRGKGQKYEERNVSTEPAARKELMAMGFMGVPVIMVDDVIVEGFNRNKLDELL